MPAVWGRGSEEGVWIKYSTHFLLSCLFGKTFIMLRLLVCTEISRNN